MQNKKRVLIMLEGGHTTVVKGFSLPEVEDQIRDALAGTREHELGYIHHAEGQDGEQLVNHLAVDPRKVVALLRVQ